MGFAGITGIMVLVLASIVGTAIRISIPASSLLLAVVLPQVLGCLVAGITLSSLKDRLSSILVIGLSTGLGGSLSSFSLLSVASALLALETGAGLAVFLILSTVSFCFAALYFARHLGDTLDSALPDGTLPDFGDCWQAKLGLVLVCTGTASILIAFAYTRSASVNVLSLLLGPLGTLLRYALASLNGGKLLMLNLEHSGTLAANILGTAILGLAFSFWTPSNCHWGQAVAQGFCGCLTTVSTLISELDSIHTVSGKYKYGAITFFSTVVCLSVVVGVPYWTGAALKPQACILSSTTYTSATSLYT
ncbi:MAG: hypothetical protein SGCHY_000576 [Lobulomycetales sp.]